MENTSGHKLLGHATDFHLDLSLGYDSAIPKHKPSLF